MRTTNQKRKNKFSWMYLYNDGGEGDAGTGIDPAGTGGTGAPSGDPAPTGGDGASPDWSAIIGDEFKEKPYFQQILKSENPGAELVKQFDGAQKLIGSRPGVAPADDAPQEDWDKYIEGRRPQDTSRYKVDEPTYGDDDDGKKIAEIAKQYRGEEDYERAKTLAQKWGLEPYLFNGFVKEYLQGEADSLKDFYKQQSDATVKLHGEFDEMSKKHFGGDQAKAEALGKKLLEEHMPEGIKPYLPGVSNETAMMFAALALSIQNKYEKGDTFDPKGAAPASGQNLNDVQMEINKLMASDEYQKSFHPNHETTVQKVKDLVEVKRQLLHKQS